MQLLIKNGNLHVDARFLSVFLIAMFRYDLKYLASKITGSRLMALLTWNSPVYGKLLMSQGVAEPMQWPAQRDVWEIYLAFDSNGFTLQQPAEEASEAAIFV